MKRTIRPFIWTIVGVVFALTSVSCDKKPTGINISTITNFPAAPTGITALVGDRSIVLQWQFADMTGIAIFKLYRSTSATGTFTLIDSTKALTYADARVQNDITYFYQLAAVNNSGLEGRRSETISAVPNLFSISIQNGAEFTSSRTVNITASASTSTTFMSLSNDSLFTNAKLEPFASVITWTLTVGDGPKMVYAKFRDASGNESSAPVRDVITLDTQAAISSVTENTGGASRRAGQIIRFSMNAGEPAGQAWVNIEKGPSNIVLYDDGSNGDNIAGDGIYELDWIIPEDADVFQGRAEGRFVDRVSNTAPARFSTTRLTIQRAPTAVTMFAPSPPGNSNTSLSLTWTPSQESADFASYQVYRGESPGVTSANGTLIASIGSISKTDFVDEGLIPGKTYYYRVYVVDFTELEAGSNEVSGTTLQDDLPAPVILFTPFVNDQQEVQLTWTASNEPAFASYRVFRSTIAGVDVTSTLRGIITDEKRLTFTDVNVAAGTTYFFRVFVFDASGRSAGSNEVSVTLPEPAPLVPVTLALPTNQGPGSLRLSWSANTNDAFSFYSVFRSLTSPVDTTQTPVAILNSGPSDTRFDDTGLTPATTYYYRVFVNDSEGRRAGSNEVSGTTN